MQYADIKLSLCYHDVLPSGFVLNEQKIKCDSPNIRINLIKKSFTIEYEINTRNRLTESTDFDGYIINWKPIPDSEYHIYLTPWGPATSTHLPVCVHVSKWDNEFHYLHPVMIPLGDNK